MRTESRVHIGQYLYIYIHNRYTHVPFWSTAFASMLMSGGTSCIPGVVAGGIVGTQRKDFANTSSCHCSQHLSCWNPVLPLVSCQADLAALEMRCQQRISSESINLTADLEAEVQSGAKKSSRGGSNELAMKNVAWKK